MKVSIRHVYTNWDVDTILYSNIWAPGANLTATPISGPCVTNGMPDNQQLDQLILANEVRINLLWAEGQMSPYLELRGCDLEGEALE